MFLFPLTVQEVNESRSVKYRILHYYGVIFYHDALFKNKHLKMSSLSYRVFWY